MFSVVLPYSFLEDLKPLKVLYKNEFASVIFISGIEEQKQKKVSFPHDKFEGKKKLSHKENKLWLKTRK